eukprot:1783_1
MSEFQWHFFLFIINVATSASPTEAPDDCSFATIEAVKYSPLDEFKCIQTSNSTSMKVYCDRKSNLIQYSFADSSNCLGTVELTQLNLQPYEYQCDSWCGNIVLFPPAPSPIQPAPTQMYTQTPIKSPTINPSLPPITFSPTNVGDTRNPSQLPTFNPSLPPTLPSNTPTTSPYIQNKMQSSTDKTIYSMPSIPIHIICLLITVMLFISSIYYLLIKKPEKKKKK